MAGSGENHGSNGAANRLVIVGKATKHWVFGAFAKSLAARTGYLEGFHCTQVTSYDQSGWSTVLPNATQLVCVMCLNRWSPLFSLSLCQSC